MRAEKRDFLEKKMGPAIRGRLERHGQIILTASGQSMFPYIRQNDLCTFSSLKDDNDLKKGNIVLYQHQSGRLIAHRFFKKIMDSQERVCYLIKGDSNIYPDSPVYPDQLLGILTDIRMISHRIRFSHFFDRTWNRLILGLPFLSWTVHKYLGLRRRAAGLLQINQEKS